MAPTSCHPRHRAPSRRSRSPGRVDLSWAPVDGAVGYRVRRSLVTGGGYEPVGTTPMRAFADTTVRNGAAAFYVVTALDAAGNMSGRSPEAVARPQVSITDVRSLDGTPLVTTLLGRGPGGPLVAGRWLQVHTAALHR